jgi:hypothetical protein
MKRLALLILAVVALPTVATAKDRLVLISEGPLTPLPGPGGVVARLKSAERAMGEAARFMSPSQEKQDLTDAAADVKRLADLFDGKKPFEREPNAFVGVSLPGAGAVVDRREVLAALAHADEVINGMPQGAPPNIADRLQRARAELAEVTTVLRPPENERGHHGHRDNDGYPPPNAGGYPPPGGAGYPPPGGNGYPPPPGNYPPPPGPQGDPAWTELMTALSREPLPTRPAVLQQGIARRQITVAQAEQVMAMLRANDHLRLRALTHMVPQLSDRQNAPRLLNYFSSNSDKALVQRLINGEKVAYLPQPMPPQQLQAMIGEINAMPDLPRRLQTLEARSRESWLVIAQLRQLMPSFQGREFDLIRTAAPRVLDSENRLELNRDRAYSPFPQQDLDRAFGL